MLSHLFKDLPILVFQVFNARTSAWATASITVSILNILMNVLQKAIVFFFDGTPIFFIRRMATKALRLLAEDGRRRSVNRLRSLVPGGRSMQAVAPEEVVVRRSELLQLREFARAAAQTAGAAGVAPPPGQAQPATVAAPPADVALPGQVQPATEPASSAAFPSPPDVPLPSAVAVAVAAAATAAATAAADASETSTVEQDVGASDGAAEGADAVAPLPAAPVIDMDEMLDAMTKMLETQRAQHAASIRTRDAVRQVTAGGAAAAAQAAAFDWDNED
jgi:hypothetical protein